jgi:chitodextrinase
MTKIKQTIVISLLLVGCLAAVKPARALTYQELLDYFHQPQVLGASTPQFVQSATKVVFSGTSATTAFSSNVTANDLVVIGYSVYSSTTVAGIISTCVSGNLTVAVSLSDGVYTHYLAYGIASASGPCSVTVQTSANSPDIMFISEISGVATLNPLDVTASHFSPYGATNTPSSGTVATTQDGEYIFALENNNNGAVIAAAGSGYTLRGTYGDAGIEDQVQQTAGPISASFTMNNKPANEVVVLAAFKPASAGAPDTTSPAVPAGLAATSVSQSHINLSWSASTDPDNTAGQISYTIYRGGIQIATTTAGVTVYLDTGLAASTSYSYTVSAIDPAGNNSAQSSPATATTQSATPIDTAPPTTPTNLFVTAVSSSQINLAWTASTDNVSVIGYKIFRAGIQIGTSTSASYWDTGLSPSTSYSYTVSAYDAAGNNSSQSSSANTTTQAASNGGGNTGPWSGILAPSRAINWSNAGLPATLPDGETTVNPWTPPIRPACTSAQAGTTVPIPSSTSVSTINSAIANCSIANPNGSYLLLGSGIFTIDANIQLYNVKNVTLRGSGPMSTTLKITSGNWISMGQAWGAGSGLFSSDYPAGTTSITLNSVSGNVPAAGMVAGVAQCDTGSGMPPCSGVPVDNGSLLISGDYNAYQIGKNSVTTYGHQTQTVWVTGVTNNGGGSYTLTISSPGLYMSNWTTASGAKISWQNPTKITVGVGLEDVTVKSESNSVNYNVLVDEAYASWVKGVRFIGAGANSSLGLAGVKSSLIMNNYFVASSDLTGHYNYGFFMGSSADNLVLNNISAGGLAAEYRGRNVGNVTAYNLARDGFTPYAETTWEFDHQAFSSFDLFEGNQTSIISEDNTWGTHALNTYFRNYSPCYDTPYVGFSPSPRGFSIGNYQRFENLIGNTIGSSQCTGYQGTGFGNAFQIYTGDPLVASTMMRWGNVTVATQSSDTPANSGIRFVGNEVPSNLPSPNNSFSNFVPATASLPASFFMSTTAHPSGGTGLSWWKVCTNWNAFPNNCALSQTQPFPVAGPEVTGGSYVNGHAYDIPAAIAWKNLPIDTGYQNSYSIIGSSWSNGIETLTVSGLPNVTHLMGGFQITGAPACNSPTGGEFLMTGSTVTTISYALASNPGSCSGGTFKFPNIRMFDEAVYQADLSGSLPDTTPPAAPTGVSIQ